MAIFRDRDRRTIDDAVRSSDSAINGLIVVLLIACALAFWYFYGRMGPTVDHTSTGASTVTEPVTTPNSPNASPTHPAPSPNPGP